jgi:hypothetical protein
MGCHSLAFQWNVNFMMIISELKFLSKTSSILDLEKASENSTKTSTNFIGNNSKNSN